MEITTRNIEAGDIGSVISLMRDFAEYEHLSDYLEITTERLEKAMFGERSFVEGLISVAADVPIGYALFYPSFASFRGQMGFYLEDIYVSAEYRGHGVGAKMLRKVGSIASERGYERIDFMVLDWNKAAIDFYFHLGAVRNDDERHFKFDGEAFRSLSG